MKNYILYHKNCRDGLTAAWLLSEYRQSTNDVFIPVQYGESPPATPDADIIYIVDFSYSRAVLKDIASRCNQLVCLDHHKTAQADLEGFTLRPNDIIEFDMNESGATMVWRFLQGFGIVGGAPPRIAEYARDWDLYRFEMDDSRALSAYSGTLPLTLEAWADFAIRMESHLHYQTMVIAGNACLALRAQMIQSVVPHARFASFAFNGSGWGWLKNPPPVKTVGMPSLDTVVATCMPVGSLISDTCQELLKLHGDKIWVAATYFDLPDKRVWSLRSLPGVDCTPIAKAFGGGGHAQACGFHTNFDGARA